MSGRRRRSNIGLSTVNTRRVRSARNEKSTTEREARLSQARDKYRAERKRESSVEREIRRSRDRDRHTVQRDRESSVERGARLSQLRDRYRAERERESSVEREVHRSRDRESHRIQRARESLARVTNSWGNKENSAMSYDPSISYKDDRIVSIGTMSVVCEHCLALKFKDESKADESLDNWKSYGNWRKLLPYQKLGRVNSKIVIICTLKQCQKTPVAE
ncbi:unnamed protein product [Ceratitis capitata]|uniref:(Mediterranean fruit fly) hypothetical protein n=1 Tax=Ceratitis capitata TaxID=7213 RepID=A0A811UWG3_CERCA|nr:unnamed protein product [Ceratitis capitata]